MSFSAWAKAKLVQGLDCQEKFILVTLALHMNDHTGQCNPKHALLVEETCIPLATLKRKIAALRDKGFLSVASYTGRGKAANYVLDLTGSGNFGSSSYELPTETAGSSLGSSLEPSGSSPFPGDFRHKEKKERTTYSGPSKRTERYGCPDCGGPVRVVPGGVHVQCKDAHLSPYADYRAFEEGRGIVRETRVIYSA